MSSSFNTTNGSSRGGGGWFVVKAHTATDDKVRASADRMLVFVPPHPLVKHWVSVLRNDQTPCPIFKNAMSELGRILIYEASRDWLPTVTGEIQSPLGVASVEFIDPREPVMIVPILRAGLALVEHASSILPATKTYHLGKEQYLHQVETEPAMLAGMNVSVNYGKSHLNHKRVSRDEETLQPTIYLNKLPNKLPEGCRVLVVDPMLATGGTMVAALDLLKDHGIANHQIKVVHFISRTIDPVVNEKGFIIPGLGDAGDRSFGT
ncbi:hypothetical protein Syun_015836 [Stephania yunnanensis]|uniref:uracil phosphoribosyltransferase n=1 Tax=Stephania yunnanensis TaxID=152371 RepID=A0AAP0J414_9MAGN